MRIVYQDNKRGIIEVVPETLDDLWHLSHIIEPGDLVSSKTTRRIQDSTGERLRSDRGIKKTFFLGIRVENMSFHKYSGKLRATGIIEHGPEDLVPLGSHHTLDLKLNYSIKITKERWSRWSIKRLKEAIKASKKPSAIVVAIEDDVADLGILRQYGIEFDDVATTIENFKGIQSIIIAGPGFWKGDFYDFLKDRYPDQAKIAVVESTGAGGRAGISEVLKKGILEKMATEGRIAHEMRLVNEVLEEIGRSSKLVTYGKSQVKNASNAGAVEKLLVIDKLVRQRDTEKIMDTVENMGGKVMIISSEHDGGKQLEALGGIAALLRYSMG